MTPRKTIHLAAARPASLKTLASQATLTALAVLSILAVGGCSRSEDGLEPLPPNTDPIVFDDTFAAGVDFQAFLGSKLDALSIDPTERHDGATSLKITVPAPGDPSGGYAGGAMTTSRSRDFSGYNALTFWARASRAAVFDVAGFGNDNTGTSIYEARLKAIPLTTSWARYVIPIPDPAKLVSEKGLFFFADGVEGNMGYEVWFDQVQFETVEDITNPRPVMATQTLGVDVGARITVPGTQVTFRVGGADRLVEAMPAYFEFESSNELVAVVEEGVIEVVGVGNAVITGRLAGVDAVGAITLNTTAPPAEPAPTPTVPAADVIALYSNAYSAVVVDKWSADWDVADVADVTVAGDDVKRYTGLSYAGIEFISQQIDATAMTHFHLDFWIPAGTTFRVKLVDFGEDGEFGGAPDSEHELTFTPTSTPPVTIGNWVSLEIPLAAFTGLTSRGHMAQLILSGNTPTLYVDNIYFHK